jgi:DNA modification methylase
MAKKMGRRYLGVDISPDKVKMAETRLQKVPTYDLFHYEKVSV